MISDAHVSTTPTIVNGLDRFADQSLGASELSKLAGARVALLCTDASELQTGQHISQTITDLGLRIGSILEPEHDLAWPLSVPGAKDAKRISAYGAGLRELPADALTAVDFVLVDLPDVGSRYYTYTETLRLTLEAAARAAVPVIIFDRPNPLGGALVEGPILRSGFRSWSGYAPIPIRHGLTIGELAGMLNRGFSLLGESIPAIHADLRIVPLVGWQREMTFPSFERQWVATSPNMRQYHSALSYPGTCLFEGTTFSEGRGTASPFLLVGSPSIASAELVRRAKELSAFSELGVRLTATTFCPTTSKHQEQECFGVAIDVLDDVLDDVSFRPVRLGMTLLASAIDAAPNKFGFLPTTVAGTHTHFDLLAGDSKWREMLLAREPLEAMFDIFETEEAAFRNARNQFLIY